MTPHYGLSINSWNYHLRCDLELLVSVLRKKGNGRTPFLGIGEDKMRESQHEN